jgi:hypothetical protein
MKAPTVVSGQNGHAPVDEQTRRAALLEQRRRAVAAAYLSLPDVLLDNFEHLAMTQEPPVRLGGLQLVVAIRRRRAKEQARAQA